MEEDIDFIKEHEKAIDNQVTADFFRINPERVIEMTESEKENLYKKLEIIDRRFQLLVPHIVNTKTYIKSITEKTKLSACFLLFHKTIQTWEAIKELSKKGFYNEVMELSRSTSENMDLVNMFILSDKDNAYITGWFNGETIGNRHARASMEGHFNDLSVFPEAIPLAKTMSSIYDTMSKYTHGGYSVLLEMINVFTKDFDFDRSTGFHRLDEQTDVLKNLINKIHYSLMFYYVSLVVDMNKVEELTKLLPESIENMSEEDIKKHYEKYTELKQSPLK